MNIGKFLKTTKGKVITIGGVSVVAVGIALAVLFMGGGYRSILVTQVEGTVDVVGEKNNGQAYSGERLYSGDDVTVREASSLTMCMDNDKYVYADANTHFKLQASSPKDSSKIKISLDKGSELNVLKSKLGPDDSYEVETPNSTMSVRGTTFRMTVYEGSDGLVYTLLEVEEGVVLARLRTRDGTFTGVEKEFKAGESALIRGDASFSEFVMNKDGDAIWHLDYTSLPEDSVERLIALLESVEDEAADTDDTTEEVTTEATTEATTEKETEEVTTETSEEESEKDKDKDKTTEEKTESKTEAKTEKKTEAAKSDPTATPAAEKKSTKKTTTKKDAEKKKKTTESDTTESKKTTEDKTSTEAQPTPETTTHTHSYGDWTYTKAPTCTEAGTRQRSCSCGDTQTESVDATGHSWGTWITDTEASCETAGTEHRVCSNCGATENQTIAAPGHDWVKDPGEPSTDQSGNPILTYTCSRCKQKKTE